MRIIEEMREGKRRQEERREHDVWQSLGVKSIECNCRGQLSRTGLQNSSLLSTQTSTHLRSLAFTLPSTLSPLVLTYTFTLHSLLSLSPSLSTLSFTLDPPPSPSLSSPSFTLRSLPSSSLPSLSPFRLAADVGSKTVRAVAVPLCTVTATTGASLGTATATVSSFSSAAAGVGPSSAGINAIHSVTGRR